MMPAHLDRLSAVLEGLAPHMAVRFAGPISLATRFDAEEPHSLRLHLLTAGEMRIVRSDGDSDSLSSPAIGVFRSDCDYVLCPQARGETFSVMCIDASFQGPVASLLLEAFEHPLLLALQDPETELDLVVRLITSELAYPRCGHPALLARAGDILFIGVLRHLLAHPRTPSGLLSGLADQRIARVLVAIHTSPEIPWSLETMATEAGMSRTAFANRFREVMSHTPGSYLTRLRLSIARRAVSNGQGLKQAARLSGYASVTALSRALAQKLDPAF